MKVVLNGSTESRRFSELLTKVVRVPHARIRAAIDAEKAANETRRGENEKMAQRREVGRKRRAASREASE